MEYNLQSSAFICSVLRSYILDKYGKELVGDQYKEGRSKYNPNLALGEMITRSKIKDYITEKLTEHLNDGELKQFTKLLTSESIETTNDFGTWEDFLREKKEVVDEQKIKAMIIAFKFPGYKKILNTQIEDNIKVECSTENSTVYFIGHFYSSLEYKLTKCFLKLDFSKKEAELHYIDQKNGTEIRCDRYYSGKITKGRSICFSDGKKFAQMILAGDPTELSLNGFSAIWIKEHRPEGKESRKYETMCRILFQRINEKATEDALKLVYNYPIPSIELLSEISSWRFDKEPYFMNERKPYIQNIVSELPGNYELFQILLDRTTEEYSHFSLLKLEITKKLEIRLYDTHNNIKEGFFIKHPSKASTIILCFPPKPDRSRDEYILIIFHLKKNCLDYKGIITETCDGFPFCGAVYIRKNENVIPTRLSMEDMMKRDNFANIVKFFTGPKELGTKHRVVSLAQLQEIDTYYKDEINDNK